MRVYYCGYPIGAPLEQLANAVDGSCHRRCGATAIYACDCGERHFDEMNYWDSGSDHPKYVCAQHFEVIQGQV